MSLLDERPLGEDELRRARHGYYAAISYLDERVGELLDALAATRPRRTRRSCVFTADHGEFLGERGLWYKMSFLEGSARVPLIVRGPGLAPARVARAGLPARPRPHARRAGRRAGRRGGLRGHEPRRRAARAPPAGPAEALGEYLAEGVTAPAVMIRRGAHKYVRCPGDPDLLYDLAADPLELRNLAERAGRGPAARSGVPGRERASAGISASSSSACSRASASATSWHAPWRAAPTRPGTSSPSPTRRFQYVRSDAARGARPGRSRPAGGLPPSAQAPDLDERRVRLTGQYSRVIDTAGGWSEAGARDGRRQAPCQLRGSRSISCLIRSIDGDFGARCALTLAIACAALAAPAAALADGQLDPTFNGTGYPRRHRGRGHDLHQRREPHPDDRPGRRQDRRRRLARRLHDARALQRQRHDRHELRQPAASRRSSSPARPRGSPGTSGAVAMTQDAARQHHRRRLRRLAVDGRRALHRRAAPTAPSAVCYAPHLIDYTARAVAVRPNGSIVLAGYARDRHRVGRGPADRPGRPLRPARRLTLPGERQQHDRLRHLLVHAGRSSRSARAASRSTALDADGTGHGPVARRPLLRRRRRAPRQPLRRRDGNGPDGAAWVQRYTATGAIDGGFGGGRVDARAPRRCTRSPCSATARVLAAGESIDAAVSANRQMLVARIGTNGALGRATAPAASRARASAAAPTRARRSSCRPTAA